jgi:hypothetical protein
LIKRKSNQTNSNYRPNAPPVRKEQGGKKSKGFREGRERGREEEIEPLVVS